jgi:hypothetical protein
MANAIKWSALGTQTTVINGADVAPTLKALADNASKLGAEVDNATDRNMYADFELLCKFGGAPSAGGYVALYLVQAVDGTNYADGSDSVAPPATTMVGTFPVRAVTDAQRVVVRHVLLPASKFKPLVVNKSGQAMTNVDAENVLTLRAYNEELQ